VQEQARPIGRIHANHQEFAMGKVDDVHHSEDDGETEGDQGKKKPHQDSLKECIEKNHSDPKMSNAKVQISNQIQTPNEIPKSKILN
jgi:hypothetical protein